jgi:death-on-curing protein
MIEVSEVQRIHDILIDRFGGAKGIRDKGILESAIGRPFQTFDGKHFFRFASASIASMKGGRKTRRNKRRIYTCKQRKP